MEPTRSFTPTRITAILFLAVIVGGGLLLYFKNIGKNDTMRNNLFNYAYNSAVSAHVVGDQNATITKFEQLLNTVPDNNKDTTATIKQFLFSNLFTRNEGSDRLRAVKLAEEIFNDSSVSPRTRARTLGILADFVMNQDDSFFQLYFTDNSLKKYLPGKGTPVNPYAVAVKMLEDAESVYPTAFAEYALSFAYSQLIARSVGDTQGRVMAETMRTYIKKGDVTIKTDTDYLPAVLAEMYYWRAVAMSHSGRVLNDIDTKARELIYQEAITKIGALSTDQDPRVISWLLRTKFHYAGVLIDDTKGREGDIRELLKPFGIAAGSTSYGYASANNLFKELAQRAADDILKSRTVKLAKISPEFKDYLVKLGWKL